MHRLSQIRICSALLFAALLVVTLAAPQARAQQYSAEKPLGAAPQKTPSFLKNAGISQNLDHELPLNDEFRDSDGTQVTLAKYFHDGRPVIFALVYYKCRLLCPQVMNGMATALRQVSFTPGKQYDVLVASIDPSDTPADSAAARQRFLGWIGRPAAASGVNFVTGPQSSITDLAQAAGFQYVKVAGPDGKMDQYAHSAVIMFATPDGRMSKYLSCVNFQPRDVRMALIEASNRHIGNPTDLILLYCCNYDSSTGRYTVAVLRVLGLAAAASVLLLGAGIFFIARKSKGMQSPV
jgi:protein SCO1